MGELPLFPTQASTIAAEVDTLYFVLIGLSALFAIPVALLIFYFVVRYRRGTRISRVWPGIDHYKVELVWSVIPLILALSVFTWSATLYFKINRPPADTLNISVVARQWMWKVQHPNGRGEINELHIPIGRAIKLTMISQDVIHSFYVPAFRIKQDVLPGRYTTTWFEATQTGQFHLFCAEYCGTDHSGMIGWVIVMEPAQYQQWLSGGVPGELPSAAGERLFQQFGCATCHHADGSGRGPTLVGLFGRSVQLESGQTVTVDEGYIRESILEPTAKIVAGYQPIMPTFQGQISEEGIIEIIAYIKSLGASQNQGSEE